MKPWKCLQMFKTQSRNENFSKCSELNDCDLSSIPERREILQKPSKVVYNWFWSFLKKIENVRHFNQNQLFTKSNSTPFLYQIIFKWHQSIHSRVPLGVVVDHKTVKDKTNNKINSKQHVLGLQIMHSQGGLLRREYYCPEIALSEHEEKLHFIALRAT